MNVPLLDLKAQYAGIRDEIRKAVDEVLESQYFILGPTVERFENAVASYVGSEYAVGVASGSDALLLALMALDIGPGDEVITSPFTFFATAGAISRLGARPVFADIHPDSYNFNPDHLEAKITAKTRAILPVHLYGLGADMTPIMEVARQHGLHVVEDAAQALSAEYPLRDKWERLGTIGHLGCYSFFPSKNLGGCGDGGLVVTDDEVLADRLRVLRNHGASPKYYHKYVGCNSRLDAVQAAALSIKLEHLDSWSRQRRRNAALYDRLFDAKCLIEAGHIQVPQRVYQCGDEDRHDHVFNQYVIRTKQRDGLKAFLGESGIGTEIYYPLSLHLQDCYKDLGYKPGDFPESERASQEVLAIPVYPELTTEQQEFVVGQIAEFHGARR